MVLLKKEKKDKVYVLEVLNIKTLFSPAVVKTKVKPALVTTFDKQELVLCDLDEFPSIEHFILIRPVLSNRLSYVTLFQWFPWKVI